MSVRLFGQGLNIVEVSDDGCGVPVSSRPHLATRYATSKINTFDDIYTGTGLTMGFRGEALFSMACLSENLIVATRTENDELAQKLQFSNDGSLDVNNSTTFMPRKVGSTVAVIKPFAMLPARRADMERRIRTERTRVFRLMESCKSIHLFTFSPFVCFVFENLSLLTSISLFPFYTTTNNKLLQMRYLILASNLI